MVIQFDEYVVSNGGLTLQEILYDKVGWTKKGRSDVCSSDLDKVGWTKKGRSADNLHIKDVEWDNFWTSCEDIYVLIW